MKLNIKNYKNINNLDLDINDNKINFIFGISGSGKTSIGQSIYKNLDEDDVAIGKDIKDVEVLIDGQKTDVSKVSIYNETTINSLVIENDMNERMYRVIFSNDNDIINKKNEFQKEIQEMAKYKNDLYQYIGKIDILIKNFGGKLTQKKELPASSKIIKLQKATNNIANKDYIEAIKNNGSNYLKWLKEGVEFDLYKNNYICPFCEQTTPEVRRNIIDELCNCTPKDFEIMFDTSNILEELNIRKPDYLDDDQIELLKNSIIKKISLKDEVYKIINIIDFYIVDNYNPSAISAIDISEDFKEEFPNISSSIDIVNKKITEIKKILGELKRITDKTISDNLKLLNEYIEKFGIPYKFKQNKYDIENKMADYILYHTSDKTQKHRTNGLSYGEKNIISLLLFLISNDKDIVIIDDPASSYDDYRRKIIFDLLYYLQKERTFIVLSHDMVFIKYAIFNKEQGDKLLGKPNMAKKFQLFSNNTGRILSFENYNSTIKLKDIQYGDFDTIENQVENHIKSNKLSYFRKIINLRILTEIKKNSDTDYELVYNYLSAILHKQEKENILKQLNNIGIDEEYVITYIKNKLNIELEKMPDNIFDNFNIDELSDFEKIFYYRDEIKDDVVKDEFNNIIHMNSSYTISLNPYKYNYFSPYVYNNLNINQ